MADFRQPQEGIDFEKLRAVFRKRLVWIIALFVICNLAAYLATRWTKDVFESESELKLDVKQDATELGINKIVQDQNNDPVSGEIEQIKSKTFLSRVVDSLHLRVSYYSEGNVLNNEMYRNSPFNVTVLKVGSTTLDIPIYFAPLTETTFKISIGKEGSPEPGEYGKPLLVGDSEVLITNVSRLTEKKANDDYYFILNSKANLVNELVRNLSVEPLNFNAHTIRISYKDYNGAKARDIVNTIDSLYINYSTEQQSLANKQKISWLDNELKQVENQMQEYENYFETFTLQNKSADLSQDMKRTIMYINRIDSQRFALTKRVGEINGLLEVVLADKSLLNPTSYSFLPEFLIKKIDALALIVKERNRLSLAYNENAFALRQKEKELATLKDEVYNSLKALKENLLQSLSELATTRQRLDREFNAMPDKNTRFTKNQRRYNLYSDFYLSMMQSKAQFEIAQAGTTPDFKILSAASTPYAPVWPRKWIFLAIGFIAGIFLNLFLIGVVYALDTTVTSVKEIENLVDVPVLGVIPTSRNPVQATIPVVDNPKSMVSEALRSLRTNLDFFTSGGNRKVITISSTVSGEGKSFLAANLGGVLAMSKKRVILVDLDMRKLKKPVFGNGETNLQGLSTVLIRRNTWQECIIATGIENLDFLPSGPHPPNPSELLLNGEFTALIEEMKAKYDFIIMDTPPVGLVTDGIMAMNKSDLSIYVVRANYSKKDYLRNIERIRTVNKVSNVSVVLNALPPIGKAYGYGYYVDKQTKKI